MRFAAANNNNSGAWIRAGRQGAKNAEDISNSITANSPDYGGMAQRWQKAESDKKIAGMKAASDVAKAGMDAFTKIETTKSKVEGETARSDAKRKSVFAGKIAAAAGLALKGFDKPVPPVAPVQIDIEALRGLSEARGAGDPRPQRSDYETGDTPTATNTDTDQTDNPPISSGQALEANPNAELPAGDFDVPQMEQLLVNNGMSPDNARVLARVGMGESGGRTGIDTVQSGLDPNQSNEYSIGLFQINTQAHGDKLTRRGWTAEDLRDPSKNAQIAIEVYNEAGGFTPWSVYNNGSWRNY